jgi:hypothetical protein
MAMTLTPGKRLSQMVFKNNQNTGINSDLQGLFANTASFAEKARDIKGALSP